MLAIMVLIVSAISAFILHYGYTYLLWAEWCEDLAFGLLMVVFLWLVAAMC